MFIIIQTQKPWVMGEIKDILTFKKMAFRAGNREELKRIHRDPKMKIR